MKKIVRLTESDLVRIVKRVLNEQSVSTQPKVSELHTTLKNLVGAGTGRDYKKICEICSKQDLNIDNPRARKAANEFADAIEGGENPLSNFGGSGPYANTNSSAYKAGMAIQNNLKSAEDICTMIKYYSTYSGSGEDFDEAVSGELSYKVDSTSNLNLMVGEPISNILSSNK